MIQSKGKEEKLQCLLLCYYEALSLKVGMVHL